MYRPTAVMIFMAFHHYMGILAFAQQATFPILPPTLGSDSATLERQPDVELKGGLHAAGPLPHLFLEMDQEGNGRSMWSSARRPERFSDRLISDHRYYYGLKNLRRLAGGFLVGAVMANTNLDQQIHSHFQSSVVRASSDDWSDGLHANKELGNGIYTLPVFGASWAMAGVFPDSVIAARVSQWGERSLRSFVVGAPPLIVAQRLTGASRPGETEYGSQWRWLADNNGVSGHAFMSALPFINAAKMIDRPATKALFYAGSFLGPLSRVNDDAHYPSQVALGWWMAYAAATVVNQTDGPFRPTQVYPYIDNEGGYGAMFQWSY